MQEGARRTVAATWRQLGGSLAAAWPQLGGNLAATPANVDNDLKQDRPSAAESSAVHRRWTGEFSFSDIPSVAKDADLSRGARKSRTLPAARCLIRFEH